MRYLKSRRGRTILICFVASSVLFFAFPGVDLFVSKLFFRDGAFLYANGLQDAMQSLLAWFLCLSLAAVAAVYACNRVMKWNLCGADGRCVAYLLLVLLLGAGLIVNLTLKDNFGRARPREIVEFGGVKRFSPPFVVSGECRTNCSFSSGDSAGAFFALALVMAFSRRRAPFIAAVVFGACVSLCRIAAGAHFISDTVVSFFVMLIVADVLRVYMLSDAARQDSHSLSDDSLGTAGYPPRLAVRRQPPTLAE